MVFRRSSMMFTLDTETRKALHEANVESPKVTAKASPKSSPIMKVSRHLDAEGFGLPPAADDAEVPGAGRRISLNAKTQAAPGERTMDDDDDDNVITKDVSKDSICLASFKRQLSGDAVPFKFTCPKMVQALSSPFADAHLSDQGRRMLLLSKNYTREIIENKNVWRSFEPLPPVRARRLLFDAEHNVWDSEPVLVQFQSTAFDRGALRECFKVKEIRGREFKEIKREGCLDDTLAISEKFASRTRTCWVAKRYMDHSHYDLHKQDVAMQMVAKSYAEAFDKERLIKCKCPSIPQRWRHATKPVDFLMSHLIEFDTDKTVPDHHHCTPCFSVEAYVYGEYLKHNTNSGLVCDTRSTPQAFSHFTFEHSKRSLICVDVQGVDDLYTDPAVHAPTQFLWCDANLGLRGMALFFWTHRCNDACRLLGLPSLNSYSELASKGLVSWQKGNAEVRKLAANTLAQCDATLSEARRAKAAKGEAAALFRKPVEPMLNWPAPEQWEEDIPVVEHPHGFKDTLPVELVEPCIHMELGWMYSSGRLSESGTDCCDEGAIYHLQQAARGGLVCALLALARLCSDYTHDDFLPNIFGISFDLCLVLLELASERKCADAAGSLAQILESGAYDDADWSKAAYQYERFATLMLDGAHLQVSEEDPLLRGISRPTAYYMKFGWENHGLEPHVALASAARLHAEGSNGLVKNSAKAVELYRWASDVAMEAMQAKRAMQYTEKADELESEEEQEEDAASSFASSSEEEEEKKEAVAETKEFALSTSTREKLEQISSEIGVSDLNQVIEKLIETYRMPAQSKRLSVIATMRSNANLPGSKPSAMKTRRASNERNVSKGGNLARTLSWKEEVQEVKPEEEGAGMDAGKATAVQSHNPVLQEKVSATIAPKPPVEEVEEAAGDLGDDFLAAFGAEDEEPVSNAPKQPVEEVEEAAGDMDDDFLAAFGTEDVPASAVVKPPVEEVEEAAGDFDDDFLAAFSTGDEHPATTTSKTKPPVEEFEEPAGDVGDDFFDAFG